jgi:predicted ester cyclase
MIPSGPSARITYESARQGLIDARRRHVSTKEAKSIVHAYFDAGHRDDLSAWDTLCAPDMTLVLSFAPTIEGLDGVKGFTAGMHAAFSPFFLCVERLIAEGDEAAAWWTTGGTHTGALMSPAGPIPPTGREMAMAGVSLVRVTGGKIVEERVLADLMGAMQQLGVLPGA